MGSSTIKNMSWNCAPTMAVGLLLFFKLNTPFLNITSFNVLKNKLKRNFLECCCCCCAVPHVAVPNNEVARKGKSSVLVGYS